MKNISCRVVETACDLMFSSTCIFQRVICLLQRVLPTDTIIYALY